MSKHEPNAPPPPQKKRQSVTPRVARGMETTMNQTVGSISNARKKGADNYIYIHILYIKHTYLKRRPLLQNRHAAANGPLATHTSMHIYTYSTSIINIEHIKFIEMNTHTYIYIYTLIIPLPGTSSRPPGPARGGRAAGRPPRPRPRRLSPGHLLMYIFVYIGVSVSGYACRVIVMGWVKGRAMLGGGSVYVGVRETGLYIHIYRYRCKKCVPACVCVVWGLAPSLAGWIRPPQHPTQKPNTPRPLYTHIVPPLRQLQRRRQACEPPTDNGHTPLHPPRQAGGRVGVPVGFFGGGLGGAWVDGRGVV